MQPLLCQRRLKLILILNKRNVRSAGHQTHFLEARKLIEERSEHDLCRVCGQVGEEENAVRWRRSLDDGRGRCDRGCGDWWVLVCGERERERESEKKNDGLEK